MTMNRKVKLRVRELHDHLTCFLCDGYFIDATTIIECLHSFCRTCIVRYLTDHKSCPICNVQVHKTRPLLNIRSDQTLQEIVYNLVPDLRKNEMKHRRQFWSDHEMIKFDVMCRGLTPEDLGEVDETKTKKSTKKLCLTIEPYKRRNRKLEPGSEWAELEKEMSKRYLRCSHDVTVKHLHKLIRMKFKEPENVEVLIFCGETIIPQTYTLGDVLEVFPCPMNQILELKYGLFVPKSLKRKRPAFWDSVDIASLKTQATPTVKKEATKAKKPISATPQLKAFFNSLKKSTPKRPKLTIKTNGELKTKPSIMDNSLAVENREDHAKIELLSMVQLTTVEKSPSKSSSDSEVTPPPMLENASHNASNVLAKSTTDLEKSPKPAISQSENHSSNKNGTSPQPKRTSPNGSKSQESNGKSNKSNNVKCYEMLDIPVAEAVRRKPPTPVEVPEVASKIVERPSQVNALSSSFPTPTTTITAVNDAVTDLTPFVQRKSPKRDTKEIRPTPGQQPRQHRRKPTNPTQYAGNSNTPPVNQDIRRQGGFAPAIPPSNTRPTNDDYLMLDSNAKSVYETVRINPPPKGGQFILLAPPNNNHDPMGNNRPLAPQPQQQQQRKPPTQNGSQPLRKIEPQPPRSIQKAPPNGKRPGSQDLSNLSNAAAHRVALDAVRSTMGSVKLQTDRKQAPSKRPILPKTTSASFSPLVVTGMDGIPQFGNTGPTRNIFQNEKVVYPMGNPVSAQNQRPVAPSNPIPAPSRQQQIPNKRPANSSQPPESTGFKNKSPRNNPRPITSNTPPFVSNQHVSVNGRNHTGINSTSTQHRNIAPATSVPGNNKPFIQTPSKLLNPPTAISRTNLLSHSYNKPSKSPQMTALTHNRNENNHRRAQEPLQNELLKATLMNQRSGRTGLSPHGKLYVDQRSQALTQPIKPHKTPPSKDPYQQTTIERTKALVQSLAQQSQNPSTSGVGNVARNGHSKHGQHASTHTPSPKPRSQKLPANMRPSPIEAAKLIYQIKESQRVLKNSSSGTSKAAIPNATKRPHQRARSSSRELPSFPVAVPPAGTKSPWSSRGYPAPAHAGRDFSESEYQPPIKKHFSQPPKAHQSSNSPHSGSIRSPGTSRLPPNQTLSSDMMPLELTSRTRKSSQSSGSSISSPAPTPPAPPILGADQPLCLVMKKA
uniref:Polycomb group protein Psc n=1 Tax=Phallusia mammillata TaxID=59560 RepID=A0A6F9D869_9ASCI|nr:polycomb group protein Psc [Phallusia mammillata]